MARFVTKELRRELREVYGSGNYRITANGEIQYKQQGVSSTMNPKYYWKPFCRLSEYPNGGAKRGNPRIPEQPNGLAVSPESTSRRPRVTPQCDLAPIQPSSSGS